MNKKFLILKGIDTMTKMTKRDYFNKLLDIEVIANDPDMCGFILHELELLDKKNANRSNHLSEKQVENEKIKADIVKYLAGKSLSVREITKGVASCNELSSQKVTALLTQLTKEDKLERVMIKRTPYYGAKSGE